MPLTQSRADVPVTVDASLCVQGCTLCVDICPLDSLAINPESGKAYMHVDECWYCGPCAARLGPRRAEPAVTQALTSRLADRDADVRAYARLALAGDSAPGDGAGGAGVIPSTTSCRSSAAPG